MIMSWEEHMDKIAQYMVRHFAELKGLMVEVKYDNHDETWIAREAGGRTWVWQIDDNNFYFFEPWGREVVEWEMDDEYSTLIEELEKL